MRLGGTTFSAACSFATGVVVARRLGETGKGVVSLIGYLASVAALLAGLGLSEAAIALVRRRRVAPGEALASSLALILGASIVATGVFAAVARWHYGSTWDDVRAAVLAGCTIVPLAAASRLVAGVAQARGLAYLAGASVGLEGVVTLVVTAIALVHGSGASGALLGVAAGWASSLVILLVVLLPLREVGRLRPRVTYLRRALQIGLPVQVGLLLITLSSRVDLLVVAAIAGDRSAGEYSVAITVGQLVIFAASALSVTSMPIVAELPDVAVGTTVGRLCRTSTSASIVSAGSLAVAAPIAIPALYGAGFERASVPAVIIAGGSILAGLQLVLARCAAMRGHQSILATSFATSTATMLVLDSLLIRPFGLVGAASASALSSAVGLTAVLAGLRREHWRPRLRALLPMPADIAEVLSAPIALLRQRPSAGQSTDD